MIYVKIYHVFWVHQPETASNVSGLDLKKRGSNSRITAEELLLNVGKAKAVGIPKKAGLKKSQLLQRRSWSEIVYVSVNG